MKFLIYLLLFTISTTAFANDGAFYAKGNQLIPITETKISVKKEILTIKKVRNDFMEVTVYYEFFNPEAEREITVGFEAFSPTGDVDGTPRNGMHPYMSDFTVVMNDEFLKHEIAYVYDSTYRSNGLVKSQSLTEIQKGIHSENNVDFYYVYHFKAKFKKGLNIIRHTYTCKLSGSIGWFYNFEYVLTAATRWANKQIDDFTLIVDMGEFEQFRIFNSFFNDQNEWLINGLGKSKFIKRMPDDYYEHDMVEFVMQKGMLVFQKKDFKPKGELSFFSESNYVYEQELTIPFSYYQQTNIPEALTDFDRKVLKNLPFARRGYVFKSKDLQDYFGALSWYLPNPSYVADVELLHPIEREWLQKMKL